MEQSQRPPTPQPTDQQPTPPQPPPPSPSPPQPPSSSSSLPPPNPSSPSLPSSANPNPRLPFNRPWPQPSPFPSHHFPSHLHSSSSPSPPPVPPFSSSPPPSSSPSLSAQKGGMAIGVPAHHPSPPPPQPASFSSLNPPSFGQQFGGLARGSGSMPESGTSPGTSQVRQPIQGIQGMGTMGSFGSGPQTRPSGIAGHHQQRPAQSSARPTTPINQSPNSQNFQGHGIRVPSVGSPGLSSPSTSQSLQLHNQPWLPSGSQGKPPLPSPPVRSITNMLSLQQRGHTPQQHNRSASTASQQPQPSSSQQPPSPSHPPQEHYGQQFPTSRDPQSLSHQQQIPRGGGLGNQKGSSHTAVQPNPVQPVAPNRTVSAESGESCNRILTKRSIQELVTQIDPSERLDPEVEDILADIADDFVESITTFGCSLAKHRKSNTLEAKDILLHLERNWNTTLPGFSGDEIKIYRKPFSSDIHKERLAAVKRSIASVDAANTRSSAGQAAGNTKSHIPKAQLNVIGSPNPKIREAA
ncbi:transcription initiation factor TFIID subunit 12 [Rhododendron vialii]|uniref:transcription initiation factor TFIID subunit 12 n=1 Tax=Rhododendron vialii TaxID=182163 RepID=UPI00265F4995|nr:transcription initiation factor TFIID subunit 12 [Rhododendron vialii]